MSYSSHVESVRERLGVTKQAMADKLGISWSTVDSKLSGSSEFNVYEIASIADWWRMSIDELIGRTVPR